MAQQQLLNQIVDRVNDFNRRVRDLEEKVRNLTARVNTLDDTILDKTKSISQNLQDVEEEMKELRDRMANLEADIKEINREKRKWVSSQELEEMENYMDLMNPINSSFMTESEVEDMISDETDMSEKKLEQLVDRKIKKLKDQDEL